MNQREQTDAWHDLKKDMADLPAWDDTDDKWTVSTHGLYYLAYYDARLDAWIGDTYDIPVRAWMDLPTFDEWEDK